jgi:hypothetical protein
MQRGVWTSCSWELAKRNEEAEVIGNYTGRVKVKSEKEVYTCHIV